MEVKSEIVKQVCEKCGKEDTGIVVKAGGRKICCDCDFEDKDTLSNIVRMTISPEVHFILRTLSRELETSISSILRNVLDLYKNKPESISKINTEDYSRKLYLKLNNDRSVEEYQKYADKISNQEIVVILRDLYNEDLIQINPKKL